MGWQDGSVGKVLAIEPDNLWSIPRTYMVMEILSANTTGVLPHAQLFRSISVLSMMVYSISPLYAWGA